MIPYMSAQYRTLKTKHVHMFIPKMGCTALSRRDILHRVAPLSTACTLAVMLLHSAGVGSVESTATQADSVF
jgi:hypothetical protein